IAAPANHHPTRFATLQARSVPRSRRSRSLDVFISQAPDCLSHARPRAECEGRSLFADDDRQRRITLSGTLDLHILVRPTHVLARHLSAHPQGNESLPDDHEVKPQPTVSEAGHPIEGDRCPLCVPDGVGFDGPRCLIDPFREGRRRPSPKEDDHRDGGEDNPDGSHEDLAPEPAECLVDHLRGIDVCERSEVERRLVVHLPYASRSLARARWRRTRNVSGDTPTMPATSIGSKPSMSTITRTSRSPAPSDARARSRSIRSSGSSARAGVCSSTSERRSNRPARTASRRTRRAMPNNHVETFASPRNRTAAPQARTKVSCVSSSASCRLPTIRRK